MNMKILQGKFIDGEKQLAEYHYSIADAMLKERKK